MGIAKTENELIDLARGKFIAFLNSDDVWDRTKLEKQINLLKKNEDLIIWTEGEIIDESSKSIGKIFTKTVGSIRKKKSGNIFNSLVRGNFILFASLIFKRENLNGLRFNEDLKIINDYLFELALAKKFDYYFISEPLTKYRKHGKNTITFTKAKKLRFLCDIIIVFRYILETYKSEISKLLKWSYNVELAKAYIDYGLKTKARTFIYKAIVNKPFNLLNFWYLARNTIKNNNIFYKLLNKTNRFFNFIENIYKMKVLHMIPFRISLPYFIKKFKLRHLKKVH